jgi:hypothetical protein
LANCNIRACDHNWEARRKFRRKVNGTFGGFGSQRLRVGLGCVTPMAFCAGNNLARLPLAKDVQDKKAAATKARALALATLLSRLRGFAATAEISRLNLGCHGRSRETGRDWDGLRGLSEVPLPTGSVSNSAQAEGSARREGSAKVPPKGKRHFWGIWFPTLTRWASFCHAYGVCSLDTTAR